MIYWIKKVLKKEAVQFWGRGGIFYFDGTEEYVVGTENFIPMKGSRQGFGVCIFSQNVKYKNKEVSLSNDEREKVVLKLQRALEKNGILVEMK